MGFLHSKPKQKKPTEEPPVETVSEQTVKSIGKLIFFNATLDDQDVVEKLKIEFKDEIETFILNQLLLSYLFFDHYEKVIKKCSKSTPEKEHDAYYNLINDHEKELLQPDVILKNVCKKVKFINTNDSRENVSAPLGYQRMYILHNNIDIDQKRYYSRINVDYGAEMKESKKHKGFVNVRLVGSPRNSKQNPNCTDSDTSDYSSDKNTEISARPSTSNDNKTNDSGFNTESEYGYATITAYKSAKDINISKPNMYTYLTKLPKECIKAIQSEYMVSETSSEEEDEDDGPRHKKKVIVKDYYLNSTNFMKHFRTNVFPNHLAKILGFSEEDVSQAKAALGDIYCNLTDEKNSTTLYRILPAIQIAYPDEIVFEWHIRQRNTVIEEKDSGRTAYKWPTSNMINEIRKLSCILVPKGFVPKRGINPEQDIEWEIGLPKAERYLELRMSHTQMRCYLFLIVLFKKFIEPSTSEHGLLLEHLRIHMFWEIENNYWQWPELQLGSKLLLVLQNLFNHLCEHHLPHYFIRGKNTLKNIPSRFIMTTMAIIKQIMYSPVFSLISALHHLEYSSDEFYPRPNLDELLDIISSENAFDASVQLSMLAGQAIRNETSKKNRNKTENKKKRKKKPDWNRREIETRRNEQMKLLTTKVDMSESNLTKQSQEVPIKDRFNNDIMRKIRVLIYFTQMFVDIAKRSNEISSPDQALLYLKQAWYLSKLLEDLDGKSAQSFQTVIEEEVEKCQKKKST